MTYDCDEAEELFRLSAGAARPTEEQIHAASAGLLSALVEAAKKGGYSKSFISTESGFAHIEDASGCTVIAAIDGGVAKVCGAYKRHASPGPYRDVGKLGFDRVNATWVGTEPDKYHVPAPGQALPHRSAVAVLAEAVLEAFAKSAKPGGVSSDSGFQFG